MRFALLCILVVHGVNAHQVMHDGFGCTSTVNPVQIIPEVGPYSTNSVNLFNGTLNAFALSPDTPTGSEALAVKELWFDQLLNHFNTTDLRKWRQRLFANADLWKAGGPIFVVLGGEWEIQPATLRGGLCYDIAKENNGLLIHPEHRFYGKSRPTPDASTANLVYLSADQAMRDTTSLITTLKHEVKELKDSRVILVGGSYAGNLAIWSRLEYPHVYYGAIASSAPILAKADFSEYYESVGDGLRKIGSQECVDTISAAMQELRRQLATAEGAAKVQKLFNLCTLISYDKPLDVATFLYGIAAAFGRAVQYHLSLGNDIRKDCQILHDTSLLGGSPLEALAAHFRARVAPTNCVNAEYDSFIATMSNEYWDQTSTYGSWRQWYYQLCIEGGFSQTFNSYDQPFGVGDNTLEYNIGVCRDLFKGPKQAGDILFRRTSRMNAVFGGRYPEVTRVIIPCGLVDPWKRMAKLHDINAESPAIVIESASSEQDLISISDDDSWSMVTAKIQIRDIVIKWIQAPDSVYGQSKPMWPSTGRP